MTVGALYRQCLFPAYAGVILDRLHKAVNNMAFPRIRGGDPYPRIIRKKGLTFSPHTRG